LKLLQKAYFEKVKMIYIDPPYNTGHDFVYNDDFSAPLDSYLKQTGQKSEDGSSNTTNKETNGRYHSDWLSMMYPRLKLAWNLLREDGVIFVSIDDNEVHHLRMIMDEVFGEENIEQIVWKKYDPKYDKNTNAKIVTRTKRIHEYILVGYKSKNITTLGKIKKLPNWLNSYSNADNDPRGPYKQGIISFEEGHEKEDKNSSFYYSVTLPSGRVLTRHFFISKEEYENYSNDNRIYVPKNGDGIPAIKIFENEEKEFFFETILEGVGSLNAGKKEISEIFNTSDTDLFDTPKPTKLLSEIIRATSEKNSIILDFFAGSGSTAHSVLKLNDEDGGNRKFICVQLPEKLDVDSEAYKAGYKTISDIAKERIRRVIKGYGENPQPIDAGFKVFTLSESNYPENNLVLDVDKTQEENQKAFIDYLNKAKQSQLFDKENDMSIVYENIVKEGLSLNSKVETITIGKNKVHKVSDGEQQLLICLENKLASETVKELTDKSHKDKLFICLESSLDDTTAANLSLNLDLKTI
jgi:adenine-specific DNA-methyltransferase